METLRFAHTRQQSARTGRDLRSTHDRGLTFRVGATGNGRSGRLSPQGSVERGTPWRGGGGGVLVGTARLAWEGEEGVAGAPTGERFPWLREDLGSRQWPEDVFGLTRDFFKKSFCNVASI